MDDYKDIQAMLENIEREIKALKCSHSIATDIKAFEGYFYTREFDKPIIITYEDGQNAIITDVYGSVNGLSAVNNNQQRVYIKYDSSSTIIDFFVCSTRPILSITQ